MKTKENCKTDYICINPKIFPYCPSRKNNRCFCDGEYHLKELYREKEYDIPLPENPVEEDGELIYLSELKSNKKPILYTEEEVKKLFYNWLNTKIQEELMWLSGEIDIMDGVNFDGWFEINKKK